MNYAVKDTRPFARPAGELLALAGAVIAELGGKPARTPPPAGELRAEFNKAVGGTPFGNRVQLIVRATDDGPDHSTLSLEAYPIDPLGKPLGFGVLGEPARLVAGALWARLSARLAR